MAALEDFAIEKRARLGELCKVVQDVNQEIIELQREAKEGFDVDGGLSDATKKIAAVGAKYGKQMEKCEKVGFAVPRSRFRDFDCMHRNSRRRETSKGWRLR